MMSTHYSPLASSSSPSKSSGSSDTSVTPPKARVAPPHAHHPHPLNSNPYIQTSQPQYSHGHSHIGEERWEALYDILSAPLLPSEPSQEGNYKH